jgi:hypothetical protein
MLILLHMLAHDAHARDLHGRGGVGFEDQLAADAGGGALSARYWLPAAGTPVTGRAPHVGVEVAIGLDVRDGGTGVSAGAHALYAFLVEDNLNLYAGVGAAWVGATSSVRVQPALGAEFFLFGLENLGVSAEWGLNVDVGERFALTTPGNAVAGVRYYF